MKVNNKCAMALLLLTTLVVARERDCSKYDENWRISACASSLMKDGLISTDTYRDYLVLALDKTCDNGHFYGLGLTTGHDKYVLAGKMSKPILRSGLGVSYDPSEIYYEKVFLDLGVEFDKPVMLYLAEDIEGVPTWSSAMFSKLIPSGDGERYTIFKAEQAGPVRPNAEEHCADMSKWVDENLQGKNKGVAIVMGKNYWCPVLKEGLTQMVMAKVNKETRVLPNGNKQSFFVVEWAKWATGSVGTVPQEYESVFQ